MARKIYVTRHGRTEWNVQYRVCGLVDVELDDLGRQQAREAAPQLVGKDIRRIIASPLGRAQETARLMAQGAGLDVPIETDARLREMDFGDWDGIRRDDPKYLARRREVALRFENGESLLDVAHRVYSLLDELRDGEGNVLLVAHGAVSRVIRSYFVQMDNERFFGYLSGNCEIVEYELD